MKNISEVIKQMQSLGHEVTFRKRSDGGYLITSINGNRYLGATGNKIARTITGESLSNARDIQLHSIKNPKKPPLSPAVKKAISKTQKTWRQFGTKVGHGRISTKQIRLRIKLYGEKETIRSLSEAERYARGLAYSKNVRHLINRVNNFLDQFPDNKNFRFMRNILNRNSGRMTEEQVQKIQYDIFNALAEGKITENEALIRLSKMFK